MKPSVNYDTYLKNLVTSTLYSSESWLYFALK